MKKKKEANVDRFSSYDRIRKEAREQKRWKKANHR